MDALELEALFVRHEAAMSCAKTLGLGGLELLARVLLPDTAFHEASLAQARETGPRAKVLAFIEKGVPKSEPVKKETRPRIPKPSRVRGQVILLDDLLASL